MKQKEEEKKGSQKRKKREQKKECSYREERGLFFVGGGGEGRVGGGGQTTYMRAREKSDAVENNPTRSINTIRHSVFACTSWSSDAYLTRVTVFSRGDSSATDNALKNPREAAITACPTVALFSILIVVEACSREMFLDYD